MNLVKVRDPWLILVRLVTTSFHIVSSHASDKRAYSQLMSRLIIISLLKCLFKFPLPLRLDCRAVLERTNPDKPTLFMPLQPCVLCVFACRLAMTVIIRVSFSWKAAADIAEIRWGVCSRDSYA